TRAAHLQRTDGKLNGKPESGLEGRYLLSGFLRCELCGGSMIATRRVNSKGVGSLGYVCNTHRTRGDAGCTLKQPVPITRIHDVVTWTFTRRVLTPAMLKTVVDNLVADATRPEAPGAREAVQAELHRVEAELKNLVAAVASGAAVVTLLDGIKAREAQQRELIAKLARLHDRAGAAGDDRPTIEAKLREQAQDWNGAFAISPAAGRQILRKVLSSPIYIKKTSQGWSYRFTGHLGNLIRGGFETWLLDEELVFEPAVDEPADTAEEQTEFNSGCEPSGTRTRDSLLKSAAGRSTTARDRV